MFRYLLPFLVVSVGHCQLFQLETEISSVADLHTVKNVSSEFPKPEELVQAVELEVKKESEPTFVAIVPEPKVVKLSVALGVSLGEEAPSKGLGVKYVSSVPSRLPLAKEVLLKEAILPPISEEGLYLPQSSSPPSMLVSPEGDVLSGVDGMVDYMVKKAPVAKAGVFSDPILESMGSPREDFSSVPRVSVEGLGELSVGDSIPKSINTNDFSGFSPLPPSGYVPVSGESVSRDSSVISGAVW